MPFAITPVQGLPPVTAGDMPQFIQIRFNGVDLGGPDASVIDFVGEGWNITRTSTPDGDVVTVSIG